MLILLIILAVIAFIAFLKATVIISYADELELAVKVLFIKIKILPSKKKRGPQSMSEKKARKLREKLRAKAEKKKLAKETKEKENALKDTEKKSISETMDMIKMFASLGVTVIQTFFKHLRIKIARIKIKVATGDAATTAIAYGAITQSLNVLLPALESVKNFKNIKKADIDVSADFIEESPTIDIKLVFSIRVWQVFDIGFAALGRFLKHKLKSSAQKISTQPTPPPATFKSIKNKK